MVFILIHQMGFFKIVNKLHISGICCLYTKDMTVCSKICLFAKQIEFSIPLLLLLFLYYTYVACQKHFLILDTIKQNNIVNNIII